MDHAPKHAHPAPKRTWRTSPKKILAAIGLILTAIGAAAGIVSAVTSCLQLEAQAAAPHIINNVYIKNVYIKNWDVSPSASCPAGDRPPPP